jgi:hypothetical protein
MRGVQLTSLLADPATALIVNFGPGVRPIMRHDEGTPCERLASRAGRLDPPERTPSVVRQLPDSLAVRDASSAHPTSALGLTNLMNAAHQLLRVHGPDVVVFVAQHAPATICPGPLPTGNALIFPF